MGERKPIASLPANTVRLISSTQIITSVSSIVKELVENALDAGATVIRVKLEDSGMTKLEVTDNGHGVAPSDVRVMCLPHFTSKIEHEEDLRSLQTYGFRGEALNAICNVANVTITTATKDSSSATTYFLNHAGEIVDYKPSHLGKGTTVSVSQLFNNVPVRKQYHQGNHAKKQELTRVECLLTAFGLIRPDVHLSLHHNKCLLWQKARAADLKANTRQVLGHSVFSHMELREFRDEQTMVQVTIAVPRANAPRDVCFRQRRDRSFVFINKRPVTHKEVDKMLTEVYQEILTDEVKSPTYPVCFVAIEAPPEQIDVNLEPNKTTVLLQREEEVLNAIRCAIKDAVVTPCGIENDPVSVPPQPNTVSPAKSTIGPGEAFDIGKPIKQSENENPLPEPVITGDDFHGFNEPFSVEEMVQSRSADLGLPEPGTMEWSRGVARDSNGRPVHPAELLRSSPLLKKRMLDIDIESGLPPKKLPCPAPSKLAQSPPGQVKMVNSRFITEPAAAFEEYCSEMQPQLLAQNPSMKLPEVIRLLDEGWRNLDEQSRTKYQSLSARNKESFDAKCRQAKSSLPSESTTPKLDRFLRPKTEPPSMSPTGDQHSGDKPCVLTINCDLDQLRAEQYQPDLGEESTGTWNCIGNLAGTPCWVCVAQDDRYALVNVDRLFEVVIYGRLVKSQTVPSLVLQTPVQFSARSFDNEMLWPRLIKLNKKYSENSSEAEIVDCRLTCNGFTIGLLSPDAGGIFQRAVVTKVPSVVDPGGIVAEIGEILSECDDRNRTDVYRPPKIADFLKAESVRLTRQRLMNFSRPEVEELLKSWSGTSHANECLHGSPIVEFL